MFNYNTFVYKPFIMKYLFVIFVSLVVLACHSNKTASSNIQDKTIASTNCPEDGICTFKVLQNKVLTIKKDGFGELYPELSDGKKTVIKFEYKRNEIPNTADSSYSEIIYAEIESNINEIILKDETLSEAKVLFGRLCFCRGATGYYLVKEGSLKISTNNKGAKTYKLNFKVNEIPQIITMFQETL